VKEALPILSNCMVVGEKQSFLTILLTLKHDFDNTTMKYK